jgi:hypothetical protein
MRETLQADDRSGRLKRYVDRKKNVLVAAHALLLLPILLVCLTNLGWLGGGCVDWLKQGQLHAPSCESSKNGICKFEPCSERYKSGKVSLRVMRSHREQRTRWRVIFHLANLYMTLHQVFFLMHKFVMHTRTLRLSEQGANWHAPS